jgi:hypothetical protein
MEVSFQIRDSGTVNYVVDWGDGSSPENVTTNDKSHTYSATGYYVVKIDTTGSYRPRYNNNSNASQITMIILASTAGVTNDLDYAWKGASSMTTFICPTALTNGVTDFTNAWYSCSSLTSFPLLDTSSGTSFNAAWRDCSSLTSFPLLDTSSVTNFNYSWYSCSSLTTFPLIDTSSGTNFSNVWNRCSSLTSFPLIDTSSGTSFAGCWNTCSSLTSFPLIDTSSATTFQYCWRNCTSLTTFPANMFNSTGTLASGAFTQTWNNCALTAQSIENILTSLDTNGATGVTLHISGGTNAAKTTWSTAANTAYTNLVNKSWSISYNS